MALVVADRIKESTTTTGTGTVTLLGAATGFQSFAAVGNGNTTYYCIAGQTTSEWEVGIGTYTSAGTTLARTTVLSSSNAGSLVNFSAGTKDVFVTYPASYNLNTTSSFNLGTTSIALNRASASQSLTGISVDGSAATLTTPRAIYGNNFDGSAALTQIISSTYGGTGNGFTKFSGPTTAEKTFTLPDATCTILTSNAAVTVAQGGTGQTTYTDGQLLIGNTTGNTLTKSTLTAGTAISVTNGSGSITIANTGVTSAVAGTGITVSGATGAVTISIGQAVATSSNVQFNSVGVGTAGSGTAGEIRATNNITAYYSDDRLKTKLGNIKDALDKVKTLSGFYYEANNIAQSLGYDVVKEVGVSAQQVQAVLPEVVVPAPIDDKYLTVRYEKLIPLLIEAIKELDEKVEALSNRI